MHGMDRPEASMSELIVCPVLGRMAGVRDVW